MLTLLLSCALTTTAKSHGVHGNDVTSTFAHLHDSIKISWIVSGCALNMNLAFSPQVQRQHGHRLERRKRSNVHTLIGIMSQPTVSVQEDFQRRGKARGFISANTCTLLINQTFLWTTHELVVAIGDARGYRCRGEQGDSYLAPRLAWEAYVLSAVVPFKRMVACFENN